MDMDSQVIKKILHDKIDEFFESLKKIQFPESVDELPKNHEIVDLLNSIVVSAELLEYILFIIFIPVIKRVKVCKRGISLRT